MEIVPERLVLKLKGSVGRCRPIRKLISPGRRNLNKSRSDDRLGMPTMADAGFLECPANSPISAAAKGHNRRSLNHFTANLENVRPMRLGVVQKVTVGVSAILFKSDDTSVFTEVEMIAAKTLWYHRSWSHLCVRSYNRGLRMVVEQANMWPGRVLGPGRYRHYGRKAILCR